MKKVAELTLCSVLLSTLAASGADFSREELNEKLNALAQSTAPEIPSAPRETCYMIALPPERRIEYICPKCGQRTYYLSRDNLKLLHASRQCAHKLQTLGLNIEVDESAYCQHCTPDPKAKKNLDIPIRGIISSLAETFPQQQEVNIINVDNSGECIITFDSGYVPRNMIDENGVILENTDLRCGPATHYKPLDVLLKDQKEEILSPLPDDPDSWVRIACPSRKTLIPYNLLTNIKRVTVFSSPPQQALFWIISIDGQQRKVQIKPSDMYILEAFVTGKDKIQFSPRSGEQALKDFLPRLYVLLGDDDANHLTDEQKLFFDFMFYAQPE